MTDNPTIFALSSGGGVGGVAVIRLSGPLSTRALNLLTGKETPTPKVASLFTLFDPQSKARLDKSLTLYFKAPASFTGEDVVELHVHGGRAVIEGVLNTLSLIGGLRAAEPGEFTRRAYESGKMDLTEAEGLNDLIHASTAAQRDLALKQMDGSLRYLYEEWRGLLIHHLAHLEADIDFPDEDLPEGVAASVRPQVSLLKDKITQHLVDGRRGEALRDGYRIVILGEPNAGKSSLMNALASSDVAIVSDEAGTTRDVLETQLNLEGFPVRLIDTAGLRDGGGAVEREGIRRAIERAGDADLKLVLTRADEWPKVPEQTKALLDDKTILVIAQTDLVPMFHVEQSELPQNIAGHFMLSVKDRDSFIGLMKMLTAHVKDAMELREAPVLTRVRHRRALEEVVTHLVRFDLTAGMDAVLAAEDVRMAARSLGSITGLIGVEDVLDVVFSEFCIGK